MGEAGPIIMFERCLDMDRKGTYMDQQVNGIGVDTH